MYLRTPKRYRSGNRRSTISLRWLWLWLLTPVVVIAGIQIYNQQDTLGPPVHQALYNLADGLQNRVETAVAPTLPPTQNPADALTRADTDWGQGRVETALDTYQQVLSGAPNDVEAHYRVALALIMGGKFAEAVQAAENTVTANPFSSDAWAIRAMALDWNGQYGEAISSALRALELDPNNARAMAFLAEAYLDNQNTDLARSTADRALEMNPDSFEALRAQGVIVQALDGDNAAAQDYFQQARDLAPNLPYLAIDLVGIYLGEQRFDEAVTILNDIIESNPRNTIAIYQLGIYYYRDQGNLPQALEYLSRCAEANPDSINCNALLGRIQSRLDNNTAALISLQKAIDLGSTNPRHYLWMGLAEIALGKCPSAVPFLQKGYELAQNGVDDEALGVISDSLAQCQSPIPGGQTTPEATAEANGSG